MKKILTVVFTMLLGATLSMAQAAGGSTDTKTTDKKAPAAKSGKKGHKGGKKSKKSSTTTTSTTPK
jgi:hypothetical protein